MGFLPFDANRQRIVVGERNVAPVSGYRYFTSYSSSRMLSFTQPKVAQSKPRPVASLKLNSYSDQHLIALLSDARARNKEERADRILKILRNRQQKRRRKARRLKPDLRLLPLPCTHEKIFAQQKAFSDYDTPIASEINSYTGTPIYAIPGGQTEFPHERLARLLADLPLEELVQSVLSTLHINAQPRAEDLIDGINIWQQIVELKENLALPLAFKDTVKAASKNIADGLAQGWLAINWGILPFVNDIQSLLNLIGELEKCIDAWNSEKHLFKRRRKVSIPLGDLINSRTVTAGGTNVSNVRRECKYTTLLEVYYTLEFRTAKIQRDDIIPLVLDRIGFTRPLAGLWEGIPFSWLVDYFVKVGDYIENLEPKFRLPFTTTKRVESIKFICTETCDLKYENNLETNRAACHIPLESFCRYEFYRRVIKEGIIENYAGFFTPKSPLTLGKGLTAKRLANIVSVAQLQLSGKMTKKDRKFLKALRRERYFNQTQKKARQNLAVRIVRTA